MSLVQVKKELLAPQFKSELSETIKDVGVSLEAAQEVYFAAQLVGKSDNLQKCAPETIKQSIINAMSAGITLNPILQQGHLIPRWNQNTRSYECKFEADYKGLITILISTGVANDIYAEVVYANDEFSIVLGTEKKIVHVPTYSGDRGDIIGAYAVAILPNGTKKWEYQPYEYFEGVMKVSESYKSDIKNKTKYSPWNNQWRPDMFKKTIIRYLFKTMPKPTNNKVLTNLFKAEQEDIVLDAPHTVVVEDKGGQKEIEKKKYPQVEGAIQAAVEKVKTNTNIANDSLILYYRRKLKALGISYHPSAKVETLAGKLEKDGFPAIMKYISDAAPLDGDKRTNEGIEALLAVKEKKGIDFQDMVQASIDLELADEGYDPMWMIESLDDESLAMVFDYTLSVLMK